MKHKKFIKITKNPKIEQKNLKFWKNIQANQFS